jgi:hypothetical protein
MLGDEKISVSFGEITDILQDSNKRYYTLAYIMLLCKKKKHIDREDLMDILYESGIGEFQDMIDEIRSEK